MSKIDRDKVLIAIYFSGQVIDKLFITHFPNEIISDKYLRHILKVFLRMMQSVHICDTLIYCKQMEECLYDFNERYY